MSGMVLQPLLHHAFRRKVMPKIHPINCRKVMPFSVNFCQRPVKTVGELSLLKTQKACSLSVTACSAATTATPATTVPETSVSTDVVFTETFKLLRTEKVEGKVYTRLNRGEDADHWQLTVGCSLPGKWVLHWGVHYVGDSGSEWEQPPDEIRPPDSIAIKDYATETPLKKSSASDVHEVNINFNSDSKIAAINFVLKDEETGTWYQHKGADFVVPLAEDLREAMQRRSQDPLKGGPTQRLLYFWANFGRGQHSKITVLGPILAFFIGKFEQIRKGDGAVAPFGQPIGPPLQLWNSEEQPKLFVKSEGSESSVEDSVAVSPRPNKLPEGFYEELPLVKNVPVSNSLTVSVRKCPETSKNIVLLETDLPGEVVVHWGVCRDNSNKKWDVPEAEHPPNTEIFKNKALRTKLQVNEDGSVAKGVFTLDIDVTGFPFALKLNGDTWLNNKGDDYFIPLTPTIVENVSEGKETYNFTGSTSESVTTNGKPVIENEEVPATFTDGIIKEIRHIVSDISVKRWKTKSKEAQETILQEIERLAAEAYSIFRSSSSATFAEEAVLEIEKEIIPPITIKSGTGSGYEILCQGFNWESHKSGKWYLELEEKSEQLASLGFTVIWLPPPTDSVSPEGYMPRDLYDLNSRYGTFDELKAVVDKFHKVGIKVLGDVVLNHRCAHFKNQNGVWNMFGGRLNWDDRAVVADDPHFQGRGNKSSGEFFHAAPNIDHSQDFVRNDIKEWLRWLRKDIGYDGWRLDFVRGFWGGYVKDYIEASEPYFSVGEFWDSLRYTYGEMDYNQDPHRQRIVDWISATGGMAGAFDVTTKGILHSVMERCEYWRLCDPNGKPPGVVGWWPSRAITFIENHDTGSTQGHWRFPKGKEMQGYAYILTHPGTPAIFYDHIFSHYHSELATLLSIRTRKKINCRSSLKIAKAEKEVYAAIVDNKVAMKIGPGHYEPPSGSQQWAVAAEGSDYKIWEAL